MAQKPPAVQRAVCEGANSEPPAVAPRPSALAEPSEASFRRNEELYRRAIDGAEAVPYDYDFRTKSYRFIGERIVQLLGYTPKEMTPALWKEIIQETIMSGETAGMEKQEAAGRVIRGEVRSWRCDMRVITRDGSSRWISDIAAHNYDESGNFIGSIGILQDITERKQAETTLARERQLLESLLENIPDTIYFKDLESRFVRVSRSKLESALAMARIQYQMSSKDNSADSPPSYLSGPTEFNQFLLGKTDFDIFPEDRARSAFEDEQEIIRTGVPMAGKLERLDHLDGKIAWCVTTKAPWRAHDGTIIGTFGISKDVTFIKEAEVKLSAFSTLGLLLSTARTVREAGQIIIDTADRLLGYDSCLLDLYSPETDILTRVLHMDLVDGQRKECLWDRVKRSPSPLARKTLQEGGQLVLKRDTARMLTQSNPFGNTSRPSAAIMFVPINNGTTTVGIFSIQSYTPNAYDQQSLETLQALANHCGGALNRIRVEEALLTAQEQLRQSQKLESVGQLAGGIAHDFNNLLTVISGNADLARQLEQGLSGGAIECLNQISAASDRAANLTRQLLAFSRKQMMRSQPVDLDGVIMNLSKMLKRLIDENIDLQCLYAPALPPVQADMGMLEQVLVNLVVNARDAMPNGGQLLVTTELVTFDEDSHPSHPESRPGDFICLTVKDTGTGISPENLLRIFDPFFTTKDVGKGTGLGLSTVYGIVKQHQGWIEVSSKIGVGSVFKIYFPALQSAIPASNAPPPEDVEPLRGKETILLVEDEESVRSITRIILERSGYRVLDAGSGPEALKIWESEASKVDLLLTDVVMPEGITGRKLAEDLREIKTSLKIIFQSGYSGEILRDGSEFLRQTNSYFLQKPCAPRDLLRAVRHCLDGLPAQHEQGFH